LIEFIRIDTDGKIIIKPNKMNFSFIYRAGKQVNWDEKNKYICFKPIEWDYIKCLNHIRETIFDEYGIILIVNKDTTFIKIPDELRKNITEIYKETNGV
jgi:hypothetical protein